MQYEMYCVRMHVWLPDSQQYRARLRTIHGHARAAEKKTTEAWAEWAVGGCATEVGGGGGGEP